jgi:S1-C subfamily serine protease
MKVRRFLLTAGLVLSLLLVGLTPQSAEALDRTVTRRVMQSVVQLVATVESGGGQLDSKWTGSGTIVSPDGLILTNCHVAFPRAMWDYDEFDYDHLVVSLTGRSDEPPTPTYIAEVVQYDANLDLAVVRITHLLDGTPVDGDELNLPALPLGNSDELEIGEQVHIFGYPGIGGETITLTSGNVSGFSPERGVQGRGWIKTDATIAGGNSGGTAVSEEGVLLGVPTQGGAGSTDQIVDCRYIADTNGDGRIDDNDTCVPMGGFINALRPINLAKPLIEAASRGLGPQPTPDPQPDPQPPTGEARVTRMLFAPGVDEYDQPVSVVDSFPTGTEEIYLFFDYEGFQDGVSWQPVLVYDGETYPDLWQLGNWDGGAAGSWWISVWDNDPLPDGSYEFQLHYGGESIGSASVQVGGTAQPQPSFSNVVFSGGGETGFLLPPGIVEITADFDYNNVDASTSWSYEWFFEGAVVARNDGPAFPDSSGTFQLILTNDEGFVAGDYRLEIYIGEKLAAASDFGISGQGSGDGDADLFGPITFAQDLDNAERPVNVGTSFPSGISSLYAFFDYDGMEDGWQWTRRWLIDGEVVVDVSDTWVDGASGVEFWVSVFSDEALPDGEYQVDLLVEGQLIRSGTCTVGAGTPPPPTPTPPPLPSSDEVEVLGTISNADTGRGVSGAVFIILKPGVSVGSFGWTMEEVHAIAQTDQNGYYELPNPLIRGETYSMVVWAWRFTPILEDGVTVAEDLESPFELNITLQQTW